MGSGPGELLKLADLNPGEVTLSRASGGTDLLVKVNATGGAVKVEGHFGAHDGLSEIAFADGTVLGRAQIQQAASIRGTNGGEALAGSWESETLDGGRGDDTLSGSYGAETYVYRPGDGNDLIVEHWYSWEEAQANALKLLGLSAAG